jgi:hypothetical protein
MSEQPTDYLISTCFDFGGRSITVRVEHDGFSYWLDDSTARLLNQQQGNGEKVLFFDDDDARRRWSQIYDEHTVKAAVPAEGLRVIREDLSPRYWSDDFAEDEVLDAILEPIFWEHINQYLNPPCTKP